MPSDPLENTVPPASVHTSFSAPPAAIPIARSADVSRRSRTYILAMAIRMVCLALLIVVPGVWKLVALIGAVVLPLFAVLVANDQAVPTPPNREQRLGEQPVPFVLTAEPSQPFITVDEDGTVRETWGGEHL